MEGPIQETRSRRLRPRFKLSTILVLMAICAWAMSYWPWWLTGEASRRFLTAEEWRDYRPAKDEFPGIMTGTPIMLYLDKPGLNPKLKWPFLALAAFLVSKVGWAIHSQRKLWRQARSQGEDHNHVQRRVDRGPLAVVQGLTCTWARSGFPGDSAAA